MLHRHHVPEGRDGHLSVELEHQMVQLARISQSQGGRDVRCTKVNEGAAPPRHPSNKNLLCVVIAFLIRILKLLIIPFYKVLICCSCCKQHC